MNVATMPLAKNIPAPTSPFWERRTCPKCGQDCWLQADKVGAVKAAFPDAIFLCTECALKVGRSATD